MSRIAPILTMLILIGTPSLNATPPDTDKRQLAVLEAAFRWALPSDWSPSSPGTIYLAIGNNQDPPNELAPRLSDIVNLRNVSECPKLKVGESEYPKPGADSVVIILGDLRWHGQRQQRASLGITHYHGPLSASGCTEYFQFVKGRWLHTAPEPEEEQICGVA